MFAEVDNASRLAQEEVFGPVLAVIPFTPRRRPSRSPNASRYGLAGGVWTESLDAAIRVVKGVRTGKMFVNSYNTAGIDDMPHGGYKDSGFGREFGRAGLDEFQELKTVQILLLMNVAEWAAAQASDGRRRWRCWSGERVRRRLRGVRRGSGRVRRAPRGARGRAR